MPRRDLCNALTPCPLNMPTRRLITLDDRARSRLGLWMALLGVACMLGSVVLLGLGFMRQLG